MSSSSAATDQKGVQPNAARERRQSRIRGTVAYATATSPNSTTQSSRASITAPSTPTSSRTASRYWTSVNTIQSALSVSQTLRERR
ncbi:MAG: hypothetical protein WDN24_01340 [Sphingomonas sp.]